MALEDLKDIEFSAPFGQSMSKGKKTSSPRSAKFRAAARRLGPYTQEGRQMRLQGELLKMQEPNITTPESNSLVEDAEKLKAATAAGLLDPIKDLPALRRQHFDNINASSLSAQDKEGIRQMFTDDLNKAGQEAQNFEKRNLEIQNQRVGIEAAQHGIVANKQLKEQREFDIQISKAKAEEADRAASIAANADRQRENTAINLGKVGTKIQEAKNISVQDPEESNRLMNRAQSDLRNFVLNKDLNAKQMSVINQMMAESGAESTFAREEVIKARDTKNKQDFAIRSQLLNFSVNHPYNYVEGDSITRNLKKFAKADKAKVDRNIAAGNVDSLRAGVNTKLTFLSKTINALPSEEDQVPSDVEVAKSQLQNGLAVIESMIAALPEESTKNIAKSITDVKGLINDENRWTEAVGSGRDRTLEVDEEKYLDMVAVIRGLVFTAGSVLTRSVPVGAVVPAQENQPPADGGGGTEEGGGKTEDNTIDNAFGGNK